jgi:hypothetical protein
VRSRRKREFITIERATNQVASILRVAERQELRLKLTVQSREIEPLRLTALLCPGRCSVGGPFVPLRGTFA